MIKKICCASLLAGALMMGAIGQQTQTSKSTTMCVETELAGISCTLEDFVGASSAGSASNPEAIVDFADSASRAHSAASGSAVSGEAASGAAVGEAAPTDQTQNTGETKSASEYDNVGISIAADYVNIRKQPNTDGEIVGKLYRGSAATIVKTVGDWVQIRSGQVEGYIMSDYLAIGYSAEQLVDKFGTKIATVNTETLKVREEKSTDCAVVTLVSGEENFEVLRDEGDWVKIMVDDDTKGYVAKEYVDITVSFKKAVSIEEEREEARKKAAAEAAAAEAEEQERREAAQERESSSSSSSSNSSSSSSSRSSNSSSSSRSSSSSSSSSNSSSHKSSSSSSSSSSHKSSSSSSSHKSSSSKSSSSSHKSSSSSSSHRSSSRSSNKSSGNGGGGVIGSGDGSSIASYALQFVGNPYVYGGTSLTHGTDCSGFAMSVYRKFGISLPRTSRDQSTVGKRVSVSEARAGDLVFYSNGGSVNHVAICIGGGRVVHASNPSTGIKTSNIGYRKPHCVRRIVG